MQLYCLLLAAVCLIYYALICIYTRRYNSTFSVFWIIAGAFHILLFGIWKGLPGLIQYMIEIGIILIWFIFVIVEMKIIFAMRMKMDKIPEYLIVLGAQVRGKNITNSLKRRLDKAFELWRQNTDMKIIVSGGQGKGEDISEAEAMKRYLLNRGIYSEQILMEDKSTSTRENLQFSKKLMNNSQKMVGIVTNNFHVYRAMLFAKDCGFEKVCGISADTNPILFLNYMVREFFAILWLFMKKQLFSKQD